MDPLIWIIIGLGGAGIALILYLFLRPKRGYSQPVDQVLAKPRPPLRKMTGHEDEEYDEDGEPRGLGGPSPDLLARMEAAGMNTTHDRWEDSDAARRERERRRRDDTDITVAAAVVASTVLNNDPPDSGGSSGGDSGGGGGD